VACREDDARIEGSPQNHQRGQLGALSLRAVVAFMRGGPSHNDVCLCKSGASHWRSGMFRSQPR
ncbi:hypothetical protein PoMZ_02437, partial [Pyricularia oryzae]